MVAGLTAGDSRIETLKESMTVRVVPSVQKGIQGAIVKILNITY